MLHLIPSLRWSVHSVRCKVSPISRLPPEGLLMHRMQRLHDRPALSLHALSLQGHGVELVQARVWDLHLWPNARRNQKKSHRGVCKGHALPPPPGSVCKPPAFIGFSTAQTGKEMLEQKPLCILSRCAPGFISPDPVPIALGTKNISSNAG